MSACFRSALSFVLFVCVLLVPSAGIATGTVSRDFVRAEIEGLRLKTLDVALSISGPPRVSGERFDVAIPSPINAASAIRIAGTLEEETTSAVRAALSEWFLNAGFEARFIAGSTSSTMTVSAVCRASTADAILIIRGVPIDEFMIDRGVGSKIIETPQGRERVQDFRPEKHRGRLILGQAFLFDQQSELRLWSRQAPDYPKTGRLRAAHPFLKHGYIGKEKGPVLARLAAQGFVSSLLSSFPAATDRETALARERILNVDVDLERQSQGFWDSRPMSLDLSVAWAYGQFTLPLSLFDEVLPGLDSGFVTPFGVLRGRPQLSFYSGSEWIWNLAVPFLWLPDRDLGLVYFRDEPRIEIGENAKDRRGDVRLERLFGFGLELSAGPVFVLSDHALVSPTLGLFVERWQFESSPREVLLEEALLRFGASMSGDLIYFPKKLDGRWFFRAQGQLRVGLNSSAEYLWGLSASFGLGMLL
jgi:hypothetical protein